MKLQRCHWALFFLFWLCSIVVVAAAIGGIAFAVMGLFLQKHEFVADALAGAQHVGFIALIWAPGIALVLSVKRGYENRNRS